MPDEADDAGDRSDVLAYLVDQLRALLPTEVQPQLDRRMPAVTDARREGDWRRAVRCMEWAIELAGRHEPLADGRHTGRLREILRLTAETGHALHAGMVTTSSTSGDVEVSWIDEALAVARAVAASEGWDAVPWAALLDELIAVGDSGSSGSDS